MYQDLSASEPLWCPRTPSLDATPEGVRSTGSSCIVFGASCFLVYSGYNEFSRKHSKNLAQIDSQPDLVAGASDTREIMAETNLEGLYLEKERFERKPLRLEVYKLLKQLITRGTLKPGQKLNEIELGNQLGLSRTPIREAFMRLEHEGLLTIDPGKGALVSHVSKDDLAEIYPIVAALEGLAARIATPNIQSADIQKLRKLNQQLSRVSKSGNAAAYMRLNGELHQIYLDRCTNQRLTNLISSYKDQIYRFRLVSLSMPHRMDEAIEEHHHIIRAFEQKDPVLVQSLLTQHIENGGKSLEKMSDTTP